MRTRNADLLVMTACFAGIALWAYALAGRSLVGFTISHGPLLELPPWFWVAFLIILGASLVARGAGSRLVCLTAMVCVTVFSLALIEPFGHFIDSAWNVSYATELYQQGFPNSVPQPYVSSYPGSYIIFGGLISVTGLHGYDFIRTFVAISCSLTFLGLYVLARAVRLHILHSDKADFEYFTTLFATVFGSQFYLRINPAPETVGYLIGLVTLLLALKSGWRPTLLLILSIVAIVTVHSLTPVLMLPLLLVFSVWKPTDRSYTLITTRGFLVLSSVFGWLSFRSDWIITGALALFLRSANYESEVGRQTLPPIFLAPLYYYFYALTLAAISALTICTLLLCRKTRFGRGIGASFLVMAPVGALLYGGELATRFWLSVLIPVALAIGWISSRTVMSLDRSRRSRSRKGHLASWTILGVLLVASLSAVAASYYADNAYERITASSSAAQNFLATLPPLEMKRYVDGFVFPAKWGSDPETTPRNVFRIPVDASFVLISDQSRNFATLYEGKPYAETRVHSVELYLSQNWNCVYNTGSDIVYMRPD